MRKKDDDIRMTLKDSDGEVMWEGTYKEMKALTPLTRKLKAKRIANRALPPEPVCCCEAPQNRRKRQPE